jgi:hypothetical protein
MTQEFIYLFIKWCAKCQVRIRQAVPVLGEQSRGNKGKNRTNREKKKNLGKQLLRRRETEAGVGSCRGSAWG